MLFCFPTAFRETISQGPLSSRNLVGIQVDGRGRRMVSSSGLCAKAFPPVCVFLLVTVVRVSTSASLAIDGVSVQNDVCPRHEVAHCAAEDTSRFLGWFPPPSNCPRTAVEESLATSHNLRNNSMMVLVSPWVRGQEM